MALALGACRGPEEVRAQAEGFYEWYLQDRLEIGARIYHFDLKEDRRHSPGGYSNSNYRGNFVGSVWGLDEEQNYWPRLYAQYMMIPYLGFGATYDYVRAATMDWGDEEETATSTDGDVRVVGPAVYVVGALPIGSRVRPFAELGYAYYFADFEETDRWQRTGAGYRFEVDDTSGILLGLGCSLLVYDYWSVELSYRAMRGADVDATAYFQPGPKVGRVGSFPMDYDALAIGVNYRF